MTPGKPGAIWNGLHHFCALTTAATPVRAGSAQHGPVGQHGPSGQQLAFVATFVSAAKPVTALIPQHGPSGQHAPVGQQSAFFATAFAEQQFSTLAFTWVAGVNRAAGPATATAAVPPQHA